MKAGPTARPPVSPSSPKLQARRGGIRSVRALVLLSGGLDSAVALWWARREGHDVAALAFSYPGRPKAEARAARDLAARAGVRLDEVPLPFVVEPDGGRFSGAPRGYIPGRNALFYAAAAHRAEVGGFDLIVGGHNADDARRFPDASPAYFARLGVLLGEGLWLPRGALAPRLVMPLSTLPKREVVALGRELGVPLALSWSCYEDGEAPCGTCPSCTERSALPLARAGGAE